VQQNLDVVTSTILPELTTDERQLREALMDKKIRFVNDEELKQLLLYIYALIGLRGENYPKGIDKDFLHTYIREYYGGHTIKEIRLAFTMAIQNKLAVDPTTFEFFTTAYFSKIVDAYRKWAVETLHSLPAIKPIALPEPKVTDDEFIEAVYDLWKKHQDFKQIPVLAYDVLNLGLTSEEKKSIKSHVDTLIGEATPDNYKQYAVKEYFEKRLSNEL
jgi:hypothetical protein